MLFRRRSVEADVRLLGILNEQYDDRDALISEISKEARCYWVNPVTAKTDQCSISPYSNAAQSKK